MKIFSFVVILIFSLIVIMLPIELKTLKEFFENMIVIITSVIVLIFLTWSAITTIGNRCIHFIIYCAKRIYAFIQYIKNKFASKANNTLRKIQKLNWQCLLIDGPWGSGKTTYYKNNYQYIDDKPNIYISCFSASRSELIAQIIQQQFWCKLLTLNGLLAKFMENNWQIFMPKNRVVVFDDLERLHANEENYLDLIGIIDYLKDKMKCQIILICNISELKEPIFNTYMERIVDETEFPILMSGKEFENSLIQNASKLMKDLLVRLYNSYEHGEINNLRIIKNIMPIIAAKLEFEEVEQVLNGSYDEVMKLINKHYLFYTDNALFKECSDVNNRKIIYPNLEVANEVNADLQAKLNNFTLEHKDFKCQDYKTWRDIGEILQPNFNDFLRLDIEANLKLGDYVIYDDSIRIQNLVIQYLEKYINHKTKNDFEHGNYAIWLLYVFTMLNTKDMMSCLSVF
ncbi:MAG: hypothetical protein K2Y14_04600 [Burkholderiales bacterium]|nr:hypothetical protein [Burkholderiales bacterium]